MNALNQTLPVLYKQRQFMVDPGQMYNASRVFQTLSQPFVSRGITKLQIRINTDRYSERSIENFLKLCQGLPSDVLDSEMQEMCEIAKMFEADQIYNTGANFIRTKFNPNFNIPNFQNNPAQPLIIVEEEGSSQIPLQQAVGDWEFASDDDDRIEVEHQSVNSSSSSLDGKERGQTKIYEIRIERPMMKCIRFHFLDNATILYSAKQKGDHVVFGKGTDVHIETIVSNHIASINREELYNEIHLEDQKIILKYVKCPESGAISTSICFNHKGTQLYWFPKMPKLNPQTGTYGLKLSGAYRHNPITSKKNTAMKNSAGKTTCIVRKMGENFYEVELNPEVAPLIAFAIGVSCILGPKVMV